MVTLYGRPGCHLCEEALALLQRLAPRFGYSIEQVNIESDEGLHQRFMFEIPVVAVGETIVARAPIRAGALEDALAAALSAS
jgi:glutaredoxin